MPTSFVIHPSHRLVYGRLYGAPTVDEVLAVRQEVLNAPGFDPTFDVIFDLRDADLSVFPTAWVDRLASSTVFHSSSRRAIVADTENKFGLARMFEIRRELSGGTEPILVVHTLIEAFVWLGLPEFDPSLPSM
jgi:hypothetical protein